MHAWVTFAVIADAFSSGTFTNVRLSPPSRSKNPARPLAKTSPSEASAKPALKQEVSAVSRDTHVLVAHSMPDAHE
jgi:hypothetical protein